MIGKKTEHIFKQNFSNYRKYYKIIDNKKTYTNLISIDIELEDSFFENYDLKYFELFNLNQYENSDISKEIESNIRNSSQNINIYQQKENLQLTYNLNKNVPQIQKRLQNLQGKTNQLINKDYTQKKLIKNTQHILDKTKKKYTLFFNTKYSVDDLNNYKNIYDITIYAYNSQDQIIDIVYLKNLNIFNFQEYSLNESNEIENIDLNTLNLSKNIDIQLLKKDISFNEQRNISISFNEELLKSIRSFFKKDIKTINKIKVFEILNNKNIDLIEINIDNQILERGNALIKFEKYINLNMQSFLTYKINIETDDNNIHYIEKNISTHDLFEINVIDTKIKNLETNRKKFLNNIIKNTFADYDEEKKYIKIEIELYNFIKEKNFNPIFNSIKIANNELIYNCYLDDNKKTKLNLYSNSAYDIFQKNKKITIFIFNNEIVIEKNIFQKKELEIIFKDTFSNKIINIKKNIFIKYIQSNSNDNINADLIYQNINPNIDLKSQYSNSNLRYSLNLLKNDNNQNLFKKINENIENYISKNYSQLLSDTKKEEFENSFEDLNNFYLILKKNLTINNLTECYYYIEKFENNSFIKEISDNGNISSFKETLYMNYEVFYKEVFFESKLLLIPTNFFANLTKYQTQQKIRLILNSNVSNFQYISDIEENIELIYNILKKINNNLNDLTQFEINLLYDYYCLTITYARSNKLKKEKQNNEIVYQKNISINNKLIPVEVINKNFKFDLKFNIEELNAIGIKNDQIISLFSKAFEEKNLKLNKFYFLSNNRNSINYLEMYEEILKNKDQKYSAIEYEEMIKEINQNIQYSFNALSKYFITISIKLDILKCEKFLNFIQNLRHLDYNNKKIDISNNLYQEINLNQYNFIFKDNNEDTHNLIISFNDLNCYISYENIMSYLQFQNI